jgi:hypothetical protein
LPVVAYNKQQIFHAPKDYGHTQIQWKINKQDVSVKLTRRRESYQQTKDKQAKEY